MQIQNKYVIFARQSLYFMNTHTTYGKVLPSFAHTSQDGKHNQPVSRQELEAFAEQQGGPFAMVTNSKPNRKARRKAEKLRNSR